MTTTHAIRCGNCHADHPTPDAVYSCYGSSGRLTETELPRPSLAELAARGTEPRPTEKQLAYIERLAGERPNFAFKPPTTKREASELIDHLLATPKDVDRGAGGDGSVPVLLQEVPDGFYALPSRTGTNDLDFVVVVTRSEKRYINRYLGGQGQVRLKMSEQRGFAQRLHDIALVPEALGWRAIAFARELGRCYMCGSPLTDETSRARGVGPTCSSKL